MTWQVSSKGREREKKARVPTKTQEHAKSVGRLKRRRANEKNAQKDLE